MPIAAVCECGSGCQECFDDIYGEEKKSCSGCKNKDGFDFDKDVAPDIKKQAEEMGCSEGSAPRIWGAAALFVAMVAAVVGHTHV